MGRSAILINESAVNTRKHFDAKKYAVITDRNVRRLHSFLFTGSEVIDIGSGERVKTLRTLENIYRRFLELELDRFSFVVGVGGGVVTDISGFAASTYMRGIPFGFVPTTLLAQADASIGGKNGVNIGGHKNIIGVFQQPQFVLLDFTLLQTLPPKEIRCGAAEIIKYALIESPSLFEYLERDWQDLLSLRRDTVEKAVVESILIKSRIVNSDAREKGERRKLNFGHTLGHAVETAGRVPHGEAVSMGMAFAADVSASQGMLPASEAAWIKSLLRKMGLPTRLPLDKNLLMESIQKDKKRENEDIHFVFLSGIGKAEVRKISYRELERCIDDLCEFE